MTNEHIAARLRHMSRNGPLDGRRDELVRLADEIDAAGAHAQPDGDEWKLAVDYELVTCGATADSFDTPARAVKELIDWHVHVALDPAVSDDAAALVERGRKEAAAGDAGMPVVMLWRDALPDGRYDSNAQNVPLVRQRDAQAAIAARDARIAELEADTRMLDWMIDHGASVISGENTGDGKCRVSYYHGRGGCPVCGPAADTPRDAIAAAMQEDAK